MKLSVIFGILGLFLVHGLATAYAEETVLEKTKAMGHDVKRTVKKGINRTQEAVCMEGDVKCLAKKVEHRAEEGADYVKDKAVEAQDKMDSK